MHLPNLATSLFLLACSLFMAANVRAQPVALLSSDPRSVQLTEALDLELRGYGVTVVLLPAPDGLSAGARQASAGAVSAKVAARATVWVEPETPERVRVLREGAEDALEAPLPAPLSQVEPATFAVLAGSVVLQALKASQAPAAPAVATEPVSPPEAPPQESWRPSSRPGERRARPLFFRLGVAPGFTRAKTGLALEEPPSRQLLTDASNTDDPRRALEQAGYDCTLTDGTPLLASHCAAYIADHGLASSVAVELIVGAQLTRRLALALGTRVTPRAGESLLSHALIVGQLEWTPSPVRTGFWYSVVAGLGIGQTQLKLPGAASGQFVRSGLFETHAGGLLGYRFAAGFGLYAGLVARISFPDTLWLLDPGLGVEVRL